MKTFRIGNWIIEWHFSIKRVEKSIAPTAIDVATEFLLMEKKLNALKAHKAEYDITLTECKNILDRILVVDYDKTNASKTFWKFLIKKDAKVISQFLNDKLYKYDKR